MNSLRQVGTLSAVGLILLGLVTIALSALALTRFRTGPEAAQPTPSAAAPTPSPATIAPSVSPTPSAAVVSPTASPAPSSSPAAAGPTVVILGDSASLGGPSGGWVSSAGEQLGWGTVVNLSSPGRGFLKAPAACDFEPCGTFAETIPAVVEAEPSLVITFGGTADGDVDLSQPAAEFFDALRQALPAAELIAISPVTGEDPAPYFLTMHAGTIGDAVEAVDGTLVDVGQPASGDGDVLSDAAHAEIAQLVVSALG